MIKDRINQDLKAALLAGDKYLANTLRNLKSAILYEEVAQNKRETGLDDESVTRVLAKEAKKRQESADLYLQGKADERAENELREKAVIEKYLPKQLTEAELGAMIDAEI